MCLSFLLGHRTFHLFWQTNLLRSSRIRPVRPCWYTCQLTWPLLAKFYRLCSKPSRHMEEIERPQAQASQLVGCSVHNAKTLWDHRGGLRGGSSGLSSKLCIGGWIKFEAFYQPNDGCVLRLLRVFLKHSQGVKRPSVESYSRTGTDCLKQATYSPGGLQCPKPATIDGLALAKFTNHVFL